MGILTTPDRFATSAPLPQGLPSVAPEAAMLSDGLTIRTGPHRDDLCLIEDIGMGDAIWDIATNRPVDLDAISCATLAGAQLGEMGLRPLPVQTARGIGWLALASSRLIQRDAPSVPLMGTPRVFFRFWPESRLLAEVQGRPVLIRSA